LEKIESADAEHTFLGTDTVVIHCEKCRSAGTFDKGAEIPVRKET
jgi:hypothetical protein